MEIPNEVCVLCGFAESEHGPNGLARCSSYEGALRPRVRIPDRPTTDQGSVVGRGGFKTYDPSSDFLWLEVPDPIWTVAYRLIVQSQGIAVAEIRVYPTEPATEGDAGEWSREADRVPDGGLSGRRLREIGVSEHQRLASEVTAKFREAMGEPRFDAFMGDRVLSDQQLGSLSNASELSSDRATRLAQIAGLYVSAATAGDRSPVASVADQLGMSRPSVRDRLHDARELGLLERTVPGKAGGRLSTEALELLAEVRKELE